MNKTSFGTAVARSRKIRGQYHQLEVKHHGTEWTVEEDALAFLTDAGLVGRLTMAEQDRWPVKTNASRDLELKLGECIWWLIVLADRMKIDPERALEVFLARTERQLRRSRRTAPRRAKAKANP